MKNEMMKMKMAWEKTERENKKMKNDMMKMKNDMMKMKKEQFLKTELGSSLQECIVAWDKWLEIGDREAALWCQAQWEAYKIVVRQFYGIEYCFSRTDEYIGVCTEDETNWLFKMERVLSNGEN